MVNSLVLDWDGYLECRAGTDFAYNGDRTAQQLSKFLRNRQPQASSLLHAALHPLLLMTEEGLLRERAGDVSSSPGRHLRAFTYAAG